MRECIGKGTHLEDKQCAATSGVVEEAEAYIVHTQWLDESGSSQREHHKYQGA